MINTKLQSIIDTKSAIGNAITNKGGTITSNTPFFNYAAEIDSISTGGGGAYSTWVVEDENSAKYTVYNGFHTITNPTPNLFNLPFNQWILNNSATGDLVLTNTILTQSSNFAIQDNTVGVDVSFMPFVGNTVNFGNVSDGKTIQSVVVNNGFIFVCGDSTGKIQKFREDNLAFVNETTRNYSVYQQIALYTNNGFLYFSDNNDRLVKHREDNLAFVNESTTFHGGIIRSITVNNGFVYTAGTATNNPVRKYHESNLIINGNTANYGGVILSITTNNGFLYAGGQTNQTVQKFHESNLTRVGNTVSYNGTIRSVTANNGFIYVGGTQGTVQKFHESNLVFVANTVAYALGGGGIYNITTNNGFIYVGGFNGGNADVRIGSNIRKFYESNLAFVGNTVNYGGLIHSVTTNNGFIYIGGADNFTVKKFYEQTENIANVPLYSITNVKE